MQNIPIIQQLLLEDIPSGQTQRRWLQITSNALGQPILIPVLIARGVEQGPTLGITAALHGNELNGIPVIQELFQQIDATQLRGTLVGVPILNVPAFLEHSRSFTDETDLNRIMPGRIDGNESAVYAARLLDRLLTRFDYLIDLHTASFGRINTFYIRANMKIPQVAELARLQHASIIVDTAGEPGTLRPVLGERGKVALTVELCDPHIYQPDIIARTLIGVRNVLIHLEMIQQASQPPPVPPVECTRAYWLYTDRGGLLEVFPNLGERLAPGQVVARLLDVFGDLLHQYSTPEAGVVIGKSTNPVNQTGGRILHLGILGKE